MAKLSFKLVLLFVLVGFYAPAHAHPHVMVSVASTILTNEAGEIKAIRHAWTFDEAFSAYSTMGMDTNKDGKLDSAELEPLAKVNVESLHEYAYFTYLKKGKSGIEFASVQDYSLSHDGKALTLQFNLPVASGTLNVRESSLEVYDPTYFVAFSYGDGEPVKVEGGQEACYAHYARAKPGITQRLSQLSESFFESMNNAGQNGASPDWSLPVTFICKAKP